MSEILAKIQGPEQIKKLSKQEKEVLAQEIRDEIIHTVSETGGHLASNLGVVELTIALHSVFDSPKDKIIWDVGHQCYVHKLLTGRLSEFSTLRKMDGMAGFPKGCESAHDAFDTGHSSTSISVALGMARARDIKGEDNNVIAVIGDGALTGGMAQEALNDAGDSKTKLIVILNDNTMSISKNVGGMSHFLSKLRSRKFYTRPSNYVRDQLERIPKFGNWVIRWVRRVKDSIKQLFLPDMFFEDLGFTYLGPIDGHNEQEVEKWLKKAKEYTTPVLIHVLTKKGKGYKPAEENPDRFHGVSPFEIETGKGKKEKKPDYSSAFGEELVRLARKNDRIVAVTAAMRDGTGLKKFAEEFPDRFFDVGIAEQHAVALCAGMAKAGMIPIIPIYSSFYQRAYDQVIHDICIQSLPVILCVDRAGIVGNDGETHQGLLDLAFFNLVPNLTIMAPKDFAELREMMKFAIKLRKPVVIRYPRGGEGKREFAKHEPIQWGKCELLEEGKDITIIGIGKMVERAMGVREILLKRGLRAEVINARFLKPFEVSEMLKSMQKTKKVVTIEDGVLRGGLASNIREIIQDNGLKEVGFQGFGYPDEFVKHGSVDQIEEKYGLTEEQIAKQICKKFFASDTKKKTKKKK